MPKTSRSASSASRCDTIAGEGFVVVFTHAGPQQDLGHGRGAGALSANNDNTP